MSHEHYRFDTASDRNVDPVQSLFKLESPCRAVLSRSTPVVSRKRIDSEALNGVCMICSLGPVFGSSDFVTEFSGKAARDVHKRIRALFLFRACARVPDCYPVCFTDEPILLRKIVLSCGSLRLKHFNLKSRVHCVRGSPENRLSLKKRTARKELHSPVRREGYG